MTRHSATITATPLVLDAPVSLFTRLSRLFTADADMRPALDMMDRNAARIAATSRHWLMG